jgi:hypothetical protein
MDYVTRQFINLTKKLRKDFRKALTSLGVDLHDIKTSIQSIDEHAKAKQDHERPQQIAVAEAHKPETTENKSGGYNNGAARRDRIRLFLEGLTLAAVVFYGYMAVRQWREQISARHQTQGAVDAANRSAAAAETANANAVEAERPWIGLSQFSPENLEPDTAAIALFVVINAGKRPALVEFEFGIHRYATFPKYPHYGGEDTEPSRTLVVPGVTLKSGRPFIIPSQEITDMASKGETLYAYGHVEYIDVGTNKKHTTHVCERYIPKLKIFATCPVYNDAD